MVHSTPEATHQNASVNEASLAITTQKPATPKPKSSPNCVRQKTSDWVCYLIVSFHPDTYHRRTYVGMTNNMEQRIRKHNGKLRGGAKYTRNFRPWEVFAIVSGFETKRQALQFEWAWHHHSTTKATHHPLQRRLYHLNELLAKDRWTSNAPNACDVPLTIKYNCSPKDYKLYEKWINEEEVPEVVDSSNEQTTNKSCICDTE